MKLYPNLIKLKDYTPKDWGFTSNEEMKMISDTLQLDEATDDDLYNYRTLAVCMWRNMMERTVDYQKERKVMDAMQSITTVLDEKMMSRGMEV